MAAQECCHDESEASEATRASQTRALGGLSFEVPVFPLQVLHRAFPSAVAVGTEARGAQPPEVSALHAGERRVHILPGPAALRSQGGGACLLPRHGLSRDLALAAAGFSLLPCGLM